MDEAYSCCNCRDAMIVGCVNVGTSIYASLVTFSVLGYMAGQYDSSIDDVESYIIYG